MDLIGKEREIFGTITEICEDRALTPIRDEEGTIINFEPGPIQTKLKLKLKNTMGKYLEVWVLAPSEVNDFFAPANGMPEVLTKWPEALTK